MSTYFTKPADIVNGETSDKTDVNDLSTATDTGFDNVEAAITANSIGNTNILINSNFILNQYGYVSAAVLASGEFGHNRWKAGASGGDYSFTQSASDTQITIADGKSLIQVIAPEDVHSTSYVLSWSGTATARYAVDSATPSGSYAVSPITITGQTPGTVMSVEFDGTGGTTLGQVQLEIGSTASSYKRKSYQETVNECSRFMNNICASIQDTSTIIGDKSLAPISWPIMRATPTETVTAAGTVTSATVNFFIDDNNSGRVQIVSTATGDFGVQIRTSILEAEI
jgi:hypothetical protein